MVSAASAAHLFRVYGAKKINTLSLDGRGKGEGEKSKSPSPKSPPTRGGEKKGMELKL